MKLNNVNDLIIMGADWQKLNDGVKMKDDNSYNELELCHDPVMSQSLHNRQ